VLHLKHSFLSAEASTLQKADKKKPETCSNVVMEEDGVHHLEWSCKK